MARGFHVKSRYSMSVLFMLISLLRGILQGTPIWDCGRVFDCLSLSGSHAIVNYDGILIVLVAVQAALTGFYLDSDDFHLSPILGGLGYIAHAMAC